MTDGFGPVPARIRGVIYFSYCFGFNCSYPMLRNSASGPEIGLPLGLVFAFRHTTVERINEAALQGTILDEVVMTPGGPRAAPTAG